MNDLKLKLLRLAGYVAHDEQLTAADAKLTIQETVAFICSARTASPVSFVLVATELALYVDRGMPALDEAVSLIRVLVAHGHQALPADIAADAGQWLAQWPPL